MAQQAELPQFDNSLEQRFAEYAGQAHPEIFDGLPEEEKPKPANVPHETPAETPAVETAPETPAEEEVRFQFESVEELAKQLEVPVDAILALKLKTKVDDQEAEYALAEIQKGFQLDKHNQNKSKSLSEAQSKVDAMRQQYEGWNASARQQTEQLQALGKYAKEVLIPAQFKDINWQWLQVNDPTQYIIQRQNYTDLQTAADNYLAQVTQQSTQQQAQAQTRQQAQMEETLKNRASIKPEWADEGVFIKDTQAIREACLSSGLKAEELPLLLTNPAYLKMADAATRWMNLQKQKPEVTNRVKTAPKLVAATSRTAQVSKSKLSGLKAQLKADPKNQDLAAAAFAQYVEDSGL